MSNKLWIAHETPQRTFGPTKVSIDGCSDVDDFLEEIKKKFALSVPSSHLTLYTSDGITEIDVGDSPSLLVDGNSRKNPLIVRSIPIEKVIEKDQVPSIQMPLKRSYSTSLDKEVTINIDNISLGTEHLKREELLGKLNNFVSQYSIVLMASPAATGKSSLLTLYKNYARNRHFIEISCWDERSLFQLIAEKGIDLQKKEISKIYNGKKVVIFLDDAQKKYCELSFWINLVKTTSSWLPSNIRFIISATHLFSGGNQSPVEFQSLCRLTRTDFLLTDKESYQLLEFCNIGLPSNIRHHETLKKVLVKECGGLVGALRLSIDSLKIELHCYKNDPISESVCLQHCLSNSFVQNMARCFGSVHSFPIEEDFKDLLKKCFMNEKIQPKNLTNQKDIELYSSLQKCGILVENVDSTIGFSSHLAKRYFFKWIFPNRSQTEPSSLPELIKKAISKMSYDVLKGSTIPGDFPKEAVFQHLFMEGLVLYTHPSCSICPELSKIFPQDKFSNSQRTISGEIDFYLNSSLRWGIELLINGNGIGEHISRFSPPEGKYVPLDVRDYAVVDFRGNDTGTPTDVSRHKNRITVFFKKDDYSVAKCIIGNTDSVVSINLIT